MSRQLFLVSYDIANAARLHRALDLVRRHATSGQKSAYECWLSPAEHQQLQQDVQQVIAPEEDRALLLRLDPRATVLCLGIAEVTPDDGLFYIA